MNDEKASVSTKLYETAGAMLIVTVEFGFITYIPHSIMSHREKIARIKTEN